jgi:hypothetical protein
VHRRLVVDRSPGRVSSDSGGPVDKDSLEEQDVWFWLVNFVVLPAQTLRLCQLRYSATNLCGRVPG